MNMGVFALDEILGLPAHPLLVHAAVVLIPLAAVTILLALVKKLRRPMLWATAALSVLGTVFVLAAANTGEDLQERVETTSDRAKVEAHAEAGEMAQAPAVLFAGVAVLALGAELLRDRDATFKGKKMPGWAPSALIAATILTGAVSTYTVYDAGHTGAKSVWDQTKAPKSQGDHDDD